MTQKLKRAYETPILLAVRASSICVDPLRILALRAQIRAHGGVLDCGDRTKIAHPTSFQGRGNLVVGDDVHFGWWMGGSAKQPILLQPSEVGSTIQVGDETWIMNGCELYARGSIRIGRGCFIGPGTCIMDADFHGIKPDQRHEPGLSAPVTIEDNVWIGSEAMVLKGVNIGQDAVVGARCVVSKDVSAGSIVVGNPMRVVKDVYA